MNADFIKALDALQKEKKIDKNELIVAIEESITSAYKKHYGSAQDVEVVLDTDTGEIRLYIKWNVVETINNPDSEMTLEEALTYDPDAKLGELCRVEVTPRDFGRIAAQNAKQLIFQKIKEAERNALYHALEEKQNEVINGQITRVDEERNIVFVDIGDFEAALLPSEQIKKERYEPGKRMKVMLLSVRKTKNGPQATVSRTHPTLVRRLFESEVPEIYDGIVEIISISREAGSRTKIAVKANARNLDPVGTCVGQKGVRVQQIIRDLGGEKIDIIKYSDDICEYISNALSPAKVAKVLPKNNEKMAMTIVDDYQFSLAIGKEGQNVRLAAKLTGWKIDIKNTSEYNRMQEENPEALADFNPETKEEDCDTSESSLDALLDLDDSVMDQEIQNADESIVQQMAETSLISDEAPIPDAEKTEANEEDQNASVSDEIDSPESETQEDDILNSETATEELE